MLLAGWVLIGSAPSLDAQDRTCDGTVTVQDGDTLLSIAESCGTTVATLLAFNPTITDPNTLQIGQVLTLPTIDKQVEPIVALSQQEGEPGSRVIMVGNGFPANREVSVNMGALGGTPAITQQGRTNIFGGLTQTVIIPPDVTAVNTRWVVTVTVQDSGLTVQSLPFFLTSGQPIGGIVPTNPPPTQQPTPTQQAQFSQAQVYVIDTSAPTGDQICSEPVIPVTVNFSSTVAPLTAGVESMLTMDDYGSEGLYNAFSLSNLTLDGIDIENRQAIISLSGELITLGNCDRVWMPAQIRQTALQYDTVDSVEILVNGQPLENVLNRAGDA